MKTRLSQKLILTALLSTFALSACGIRGDLQTPPPLWGDKDKQTQQQKNKNDKQTDKQESDN